MTANLTQAQVEELTRALGSARYDCGDTAMILMRKSQVEHVLALLRLAQDRPSVELVKLREAAVELSASDECNMADNEHAMFKAAYDYARSVEERGEQASIPTAEAGHE